MRRFPYPALSKPDSNRQSRGAVRVGSRYELFVDNGAGGGTEGDYNRNGSEPLLRRRELPDGVTIDLGATTVVDDQTQFNARGRCLATGTVVIGDFSGHQQIISINPLGRIRLD